jgi:hypothetical protein
MGNQFGQQLVPGESYARPVMRAFSHLGLTARAWKRQIAGGEV